MATTKINTFGYSSEYYSITIVDKPPYIKTFSVDGSGKRLLSKNIIKGWINNLKNTNINNDITNIENNVLKYDFVCSNNSDKLSKKFNKINTIKNNLLY